MKSYRSPFRIALAAIAILVAVGTAQAAPEPIDTQALAPTVVAEDLRADATPAGLSSERRAGVGAIVLVERTLDARLTHPLVVVVGRDIVAGADLTAPLDRRVALAGQGRSPRSRRASEPALPSAALSKLRAAALADASVNDQAARFASSVTTGWSGARLPGRHRS